MANNLPKYWVVRFEKTNLFIQTVVSYINSNSNLEFIGYPEPDTYPYYGYVGEYGLYNNLEGLVHYPEILTIQEFINLSKETNMKYKQGDILVTEGTNLKRKVLGVCGEVYFLSKQNVSDVADNVPHTQFELDTLKLVLSVEPEHKPTIDITLEEIAKWKGVEVEQIKIKQ
ncbi:MAG: hypothetical protein AABY22_31705 [Nanoarchaeota archaeon]